MRSLTFFLAIGLFLVLGISGPVWAQDEATDADRAAYEAAQKKFGWVIGTWREDNYGGTLIFSVATDGTLSGHIGRVSKYMEDAGYYSGQQVFRGWNNDGVEKTAWGFNWATGGQAFEMTNFKGNKWEPGGVIHIRRGETNLRLPNTMLSLLGRYGTWTRADGGITESLSDAFADFRSSILGTEKPATTAEERAIADRFIDRLGYYSEKSPEAKDAYSALRLMRERDRLLSRGTVKDATDAVANGGEGERQPLLRNLATRLMDQTGFLAGQTGDQPFTAEESAKIFKLAKNLSYFRDDVTNPEGAIQGNSKSQATKLLSVLFGWASIERAAQDRDGNLLMSGVRNLAAPAGKDVGLSTFLDIPGSIAAGMTDITKDGYLQSADALSAVTEAMQNDGDPAALERAIAKSREVENTLSQKNYSAAIEKAITDRIVDKVPFVRSVFSWLE